MAQQIINVGSRANSGGGDPLRDALIKVNENFTEVYGKIVALEDGNIITDIKGNVFAEDSTLLVDAVNGIIPYSVLSGVPTIPTDVGDLTDTGNLLSGGFSGSYNDLTNKPTIPSLGNIVFDANGITNPTGEIIDIQAPLAQLQSTDGTYIWVEDGYGAGIEVTYVGGSRIWKFDSAGALTFPDTTVQTTAWAGIPGPYADDSAAASAGVTVGYPYYKTGTGGQVFVRLS